MLISVKLTSAFKPLEEQKESNVLKLGRIERTVWIFQDK
jgi:hypothetical protein